MEIGFNFRTPNWDFSKAKPLFLHENKGVQRFYAIGHLKVEIIKLKQKNVIGRRITNRGWTTNNQAPLPAEFYILMLRVDAVHYKKEYIYLKRFQNP